MPRKRSKRPNWPYRLTWLGLLLMLSVYVGLQTYIGAMTFGRRSYGIDWGLAFVASCLDAIIATWFVAVGASIGSFLNVVAYRLPLGRNIGGHSSCPYCRTPIDSFDNVPVLAWIKLRGRCRTCRLPISMQYPMVELAVAIVFFFVFQTEFASNGANLPGLPTAVGRGVLRVTVTAEVAMRLVAYLFILCSLIAAALIAVKRRRVPLVLYVWAIIPLATLAMISPSILVVPWRSAVPVGPIEARLDAIVTMVCGAVAGIAVARLLAPIAYRGFDRSLMAGDAKSVAARQFISGLAVAGALVGWQSVVSLAWSIVLCGLSAVLLVSWLFAKRLDDTRVREAINLADLTVWTWLGLMIFRATWSIWFEWKILPAALPEVVRHVLGAILLAPLVAWLTRLANPAIIEHTDAGASNAAEPAERVDEEPHFDQASTTTPLAD
jgi:leader peptidase (prepilin peptidase)/N-methyltransferase